VYGQTGTDADANESKSAWVADMYSRISTQYLAVRAVGWFNINKELSWSLNGTAQNGLPNTGMTSYRQTIAAQGYSGSFSPLVGGTMVWQSPHVRRRSMMAATHDSWLDLQHWQLLWANGIHAYVPSSRKRCASTSTVSVLERLPVAVGGAYLDQERQGFAQLQSQTRQDRLDKRLDEIAAKVAEMRQAR